MYLPYNGLIWRVPNFGTFVTVSWLMTFKNFLLYSTGHTGILLFESDIHNTQYQINVNSESLYTAIFLNDNQSDSSACVKCTYIYTSLDNKRVNNTHKYTHVM